LIVSNGIAFVPVEVETEAGAVPARTNPFEAVLGHVTLRSAVGVVRSFAAVSNGIAAVVRIVPETRVTFASGKVSVLFAVGVPANV
jgi:hypothetical protein